MGYPAGVATRQIQVGPFYDSAGNLITQGTATVTASRAVRWIADGSIIYAVPETRQIDATGKATFVRPTTDQPGFDDGSGGYVTNWNYRARVNIPGKRVINESAFPLPAGGVYQVSFDLSTTVTGGVVTVVDGSTRDAAVAAASAAAASATSASGFASLAGTSATAASGSASAANTSATNASGSATSASGSASAANTSATNASGSATSASGSATAAGTSATNASGSATSASTSATNAATSESNALSYRNAAQTARDQAVAVGTTNDTILLGLLNQTGPVSASRARLNQLFTPQVANFTALVALLPNVPIGTIATVGQFTLTGAIQHLMSTWIKSAGGWSPVEGTKFLLTGQTNYTDAKAGVDAIASFQAANSGSMTWTAFQLADYLDGSVEYIWESGSWKLFNVRGNAIGAAVVMQGDVSNDSGVGTNSFVVRGGVATWNFAVYSGNQRSNNNAWGSINSLFMPRNDGNYVHTLADFFDSAYGISGLLVRSDGLILQGVKYVGGAGGGGVNGIRGTVSWPIVGS